ncbi:hypothetical protein [Methanosarcina mazei]|uniref:Uncharacterized protein n=2 Tax=Methanosarcina mazei TaxID=2209 RepID=A0A0F8MAH5_METMZ|nr:hypothetical protein [Methanosarcina mazei]AKB72059.1 hypothetical protein MSMAC_2169 [Methanosarcina mazei C16]KKG14089.1 hypothetical protein DU34_10405 [Methanosarcina mazei]KKG35163.1 hypothetical protein DU49_17450 [Methanosarcina mazei]KKG40064.1 hypothetical protein DU39_11275 [Methanosarcina mazei]KKG44566.1 hypothetical protein DU35_11660 [Methanosarcina mazei]
MKAHKKRLDYIYTESEEAFWKYHSMGCGYCGEWEKKQVQPGNPVTFHCPKCGSAYLPVQDIAGNTMGFAGNSIEMFARATDAELISEMIKRGYQL